MTPFLTVKLFSCLKSVWFDLLDKKTVNDKLFMFLGEVVCNVIAIIKLSPNLRKPGIQELVQAFIVLEMSHKFFTILDARSASTLKSHGQ